MVKNNFPKNDTQFEVTEITEVTGDKEHGWQITRSEGWCFFIQPDSPVEPEAGMSARFYGRGMGGTVRGLFLNGEKVYYRTEAEEKEHSEIQMYGADAADWLKRWDEGKGVWSIEMGGLGPGYEQAIQITVAEIIRIMFAQNIDAKEWSGNEEVAKRDTEAVRTAAFESGTLNKLGLSGAQFGAAMSLASHIYRDGPRVVMNTEAIKDRHIQVQRTFPVA